MKLRHIILEKIKSDVEKNCTTKQESNEEQLKETGARQCRGKVLDEVKKVLQAAWSGTMSSVVMALIEM